MLSTLLSLVLFLPLLTYKIPVTVTAYTNRIQETDSTPNITASQKKVNENYVALSRDIEKKYNLKFGDSVYIENYGWKVFEDRMHKRKKNQADIFMFSLKKAKKHGIRKSMLYITKGLK